MNHDLVGDKPIEGKFHPKDCQCGPNCQCAGCGAGDSCGCGTKPQQSKPGDSGHPGVTGQSGTRVDPSNLEGGAETKGDHSHLVQK